MQATPAESAGREALRAAEAAAPHRKPAVLFGTVREHLRSRWPEWATLSLFSTIVAYAIPYHEPWADEAQAWQIARSVSLSALFKSYVRYEGSPGLWHALLWGMNRIGIGFTALHWICGAVAAAAVSLLIFCSPFPRYLRLSLPFSYFLIFQYAVVARSYVLVPLLLFLTAMFWRKGPLRIAVLLGLMANLSAHAAVISGGLAIVYLVSRLRQSPAVARKPLLRFTLVLAAFYAFAIWTMWPPHDLPIAYYRGESRPILSWAVTSIAGGICEPWFFFFPFWIAIVLWLSSRRELLFLVPVLLFAGFSGIVYVQLWQMGLLVPLLVAALWITWPAQVSKPSRLELIGRFALLYMIASQCAWAAFALIYDHYEPYCSNLAAAQFLKTIVQPDEMIAVTYVGREVGTTANAVGILPYFDRKILANWDRPFWWWSVNNKNDARFLAVLAAHPRIVLVEAQAKQGESSVRLDQPELQGLVQMGYSLTNSFCGAMPERLQLAPVSCHLIYQKAK